MPEFIDRDDAVAAAIQQRREDIDDAHVTDYDFIDDETGDKMAEEKVAGPEGTTQTFEYNRSAMLSTAPSTTTTVDILVTEAELVADGVDLDNPHVPATAEKWTEAVDRLESEGLEPAWTDGGASA